MNFADAWTQELMSNGHDGVILETKPGILDRGISPREIVVLNPAGVKSSTGNRGTFDPKRNNVNESTEPTT